MQVAWTHPLSIGEGAPFDGAAPLHWDGERVVIPVHRHAFDREARSREEAKRGYQFDLHRVASNGAATVTSFEIDAALPASAWSFLTLPNELLLHVGTFHRVPSGERVEALPFADASEFAGRGVFHWHAGLLVFTGGRGSKIFCFDTDAGEVRWTLEPSNGRSASVAPVACQDGELVCSARDGLIYVDIARGVVLRRRSLPGIDRLFPPVEFEGDLLFPYANRASGGLVRFASGTGDVAWKCVRRGQITPTKGHRLLVHERTAVLSVNGGSSLVGVDVDTGETRWSFRAQWLYTPLEVDGSSIIFGTAGGHGRHLRRHDVRTGETEWAVPMKGGCPYYARCGECLVAGDWNGVLRSVRATDGVVVDEARVGPHLAGPPLVVGDRIYVLRWSPDGAGTALLALDV